MELYVHPCHHPHLGQETTATNLTFALLYLHRNPEWKRLASLEAEQVLGSKDNVDFSDLDRLPIISSCLKEALRLAPPASIMGVETVDPLVIPNDGECGRCDDDDKDFQLFGAKQLGTADNVDASTIPCGLRQVGKVIPAGTRALISVYSLHRHSLLWSNAEKFLPSRWSAKTNETSTPFAFIPFSMGRRSCIGQVRVEKGRTYLSVCFGV